MSKSRNRAHDGIWMYRKMFESRYFEQCIKQAYFEGKKPLFNMAKGPIPGEMHLSMGQEPCAVGVCAHLEPADFVTATHRPHHIAIAKGVDLNAMAAEIFGRETGLSGGRGGHMHLFDAKVNFSCSGIIAQGLGPAVGAAQSFAMQGKRSVAVAFLGEGAANQGAFHEALNLASVWRAPVVFVIEDNGYGISIAKKSCTAVERNTDRAPGYAMPALFIEDNDPDAIHVAAGKAIADARGGSGPTLIEIKTARLEGHFVGDPEGYRPPGEVKRLTELDPIPAYRSRLIDGGVAAHILNSEEQSAKAAVDAAFAFARNSKLPPAEWAGQHVFVERA
jgi:pyruvate dehydrogenase E1 component alpha subunit